VQVGDLPLAGPFLLVVAGAIGLVVSLRRGRRAADRLTPGEDTEETLVLGGPDDD